jgi:hypothetical protein
MERIEVLTRQASMHLLDRWWDEIPEESYNAMEAILLPLTLRQRRVLAMKHFVEVLTDQIEDLHGQHEVDDETFVLVFAAAIQEFTLLYRATLRTSYRWDEEESPCNVQEG